MNSEPTVGELQTGVGTGQMGTVTLAEGQSSSPGSVASGGIAFAPLTTGMTTVSATIPGFLATDAASRTVEVTFPSIAVSGLPVTVGSGLQSFCCGVRLSASAHGGVTVRIESSDPSTALVAPDQTTAGTAFIEVFVPDGSTNLSFVVQGVAGATGTVTVDATANGFIAGSGAVTVVPAALDIINLAANTSAGAADDPFQIRVGVPNATNTSLLTVQSVRIGGGSLTATIVNGDGAVAELVTTAATGQMVTVSITEGQSASPNNVATGGVAFRPVAPGTTTVSATIPGVISTDNATRDVTVNP